MTFVEPTVMYKNMNTLESGCIYSLLPFKEIIIYGNMSNSQIFRFLEFEWGGRNLKDFIQMYFYIKCPMSEKRLTFEGTIKHAFF